MTTRGGVDWPHLFFSSAGRLGRTPFVAAILVVFALFAAFDALASGPFRTVTAWLVFTVLFFTACCLIAKRLHDRGRSGWWTAIVIYAFILAWPRPESVLGFIGIAVVALAVADLALLGGQKQANRFGPPPGVVR